MSRVIGILDISVRRTCRKTFTSLGFALKSGSDLVTCGLGVPFVEDINDTKLLFIFAVKAIVVIVDGDKPNVIFGKRQLNIPSGLNIISAETGQVLDDNDSDLAVLHIRHHTFKAGAVEIRTAEAIVNIEFRVAESLALGVIREDLSLILNAVGLALHGILMAESAIQCCNFFVCFVHGFSPFYS